MKASWTLNHWWKDQGMKEERNHRLVGTAHSTLNTPPLGFNSCQTFWSFCIPLSIFFSNMFCIDFFLLVSADYIVWTGFDLKTKVMFASLVKKKKDGMNFKDIIWSRKTMEQDTSPKTADMDVSPLGFLPFSVWCSKWQIHINCQWELGWGAILPSSGAAGVGGCLALSVPITG